MISRSVVLDKQSVNLLLSNIIIIKNDPVTKTNKLIKDYTGKHDYEAIDKIIDKTYKLRDQLVQFKEYFNLVFSKTRHEKFFLNLDKRINEICVKSKDRINLDTQNKESLMLGRKKKREYDKEDSGTNRFKALNVLLI